MTHRCECPDDGVWAFPESAYEPEELKAASHKAGKCPGDVDVRLFRRGDRLLWLCSCCCRSGGVPIDESPL